jgi:predicted dienelactone hydrolase
MTGQHSDDRTNEVNRVADAHAVLHALTTSDPAVPADVAAAIDESRIVLAGHSYGAYTAYATAAGSRGVAAHPAVRAVIGFQPYMRSMSDALLGRVEVPSLLVVSELDRTTPAEVDANRAWQLLPGRPSWRLDLEGAGHHAVSDIALYAELAVHVPHLPALVRDYLALSATGSESAAGRSWRELMALQVRAAWAFLQVAVGPDRDAGEAAADDLARTRGVTLQRR